MKIFYSIRVIEAETKEEAVRKAEDGVFVDDHPASDIVINSENVKIY